MREPTALRLRVHPYRRSRGGRAASSTIAKILTILALGPVILLAGLRTQALGLLLALKVTAVDLRARLRLVLLALTPLVALLYFVTAEPAMDFADRPQLVLHLARPTDRPQLVVYLVRGMPGTRVEAPNFVGTVVRDPMQGAQLGLVPAMTRSMRTSRLRAVPRRGHRQRCADHGTAHEQSG